MAKKSAMLGHALKSMREQRKLTQDEVARISGLSQAGIGGIERGRGQPRGSTLLLFVTALATRAALNPVEIQRLANLTGREPGFFESANDRTGARVGRPEVPPAVQRRVELASRLQRALDSILASGAEAEAVELLESIARWSSATRLIASSDQPRSDGASTKDRAALRTIRVAYPEEPGPVRGSISQTFRTYGVPEDGDDAERRDAEHHEGGNANAS
jgi:transcriptional regulator with XRE-family HTH domain